MTTVPAPVAMRWRSSRAWTRACTSMSRPAVPAVNAPRASGSVRDVDIPRTIGIRPPGLKSGVRLEADHVRLVELLRRGLRVLRARAQVLGPDAQVAQLAQDLADPDPQVLRDRVRRPRALVPGRRR